jgi:hypothetical protein
VSSLQSAYIFERNIDYNGSPKAERAAACYHLADVRRLRVVDEFLAWDEASAIDPKPQELIDAVNECIRTGSALITHSLDVLSTEPKVREWVMESLAGLDLLTVAPREPDAPRESR